MSDPTEQVDRRLAREAVRSNALTHWQAENLLAGQTSGFKVDRYVLLNLLGQGGMGRVYLALDPRLNRRMAIKILSPERLGNSGAIVRFQRRRGSAPSCSTRISCGSTTAAKPAAVISWSWSTSKESPSAF